MNMDKDRFGALVVVRPSPIYQHQIKCILMVEWRAKQTTSYIMYIMKIRRNQWRMKIPRKKKPNWKDFEENYFNPRNGLERKKKTETTAKPIFTTQKGTWFFLFFFLFIQSLNSVIPLRVNLFMFILFARFIFSSHSLSFVCVFYQTIFNFLLEPLIISHLVWENQTIEYMLDGFPFERKKKKKHKIDGNNQISLIWI